MQNKFQEILLELIQKKYKTIDGMTKNLSPAVMLKLVKKAIKKLQTQYKGSIFDEVRTIGVWDFQTTLDIVKDDKLEAQINLAVKISVIGARELSQIIKEDSSFISVSFTYAQNFGDALRRKNDMEVMNKISDSIDNEEDVSGSEGKEDSPQGSGSQDEGASE